MRSSEAARKAGVNVQTLRYYERRGILPAPVRLESGYRSYGADAVRRVRFVRRAQQLGFSLEEIDVLLDLGEGGPSNCEAASRVAREKIGELDDRIASLVRMRQSLAKLVETCQLSRNRRDCPLIEALDTHGDEGNSRNA